MVHDLTDDAPRYVAAALKAVGPAGATIYDLIDNYKPPSPNNMTDLLADERRGRSADDRPTSYDVKEMLIIQAIDDINLANPDKILDDDGESTGGDVIDHPSFRQEDGDTWRFADGVDPDTLVDARGEPLLPEPVLGGLFDPETGAWAQNIRTPNPEGFGELRESMSEFGWLRQLPAIADENGVIIAGRRRMAVAKELGIEPVITVRRFGAGEAADAERAKLAIASNIGFEKISPADRRQIAATMYGKGWSMARIAETLRVATMTVSRDLRGLTDVKPPAARGGRPRKPEERPPAPTPANDPPAPPAFRPAAIAPEPGPHTFTIPDTIEGAAERLEEIAAEEQALNEHVTARVTALLMLSRTIHEQVDDLRRQDFRGTDNRRQLRKAVREAGRPPHRGRRRAGRGPMTPPQRSQRSHREPLTCGVTSVTSFR
jgi:hypothetical protein